MVGVWVSFLRLSSGCRRSEERKSWIDVRGKQWKKVEVKIETSPELELRVAGIEEAGSTVTLNPSLTLTPRPRHDQRSGTRFRLDHQIHSGSSRIIF